MSKTLFIILLAMIYHLTVQAQAVYIDSNTGDDNNPGTKEAPVFSIQKAAEMISRNLRKQVSFFTILY